MSWNWRGGGLKEWMRRLEIREQRQQREGRWAGGEVGAWMCRPEVLGAAFVLAVNDHVLKPAPGMPGWLTGKLSDVAGLFVCPVVVAVVWVVASGGCRRGRLRWVAWGSCAVVAGGFCVLNLSPGVAETVSGVWGRHTADPTDLWCLVSVGLAGVWMCRRVAQGRVARPRQSVRVGALVACAVCCVATPYVPKQAHVRPTWVVAGGSEDGSKAGGLMVRGEAELGGDGQRFQCGKTADVELELENASERGSLVRLERALVEWSLPPVRERGLMANAELASETSRWHGDLGDAVVVYAGGQAALTAKIPPDGESGLPLGRFSEENARGFAALVYAAVPVQPVDEDDTRGRRGVVCGPVGSEASGDQLTMHPACLASRDMLMAAWPVKSGKSGVAVYIRAWNLGTSTAKVGLGMSLLDVVGGGAHRSSPEPSRWEIGGGGVEDAYLVFEFDNEESWNRRRRGGRLTIPVTVGDGPAIDWQIPMQHVRAGANVGPRRPALAGWQSAVGRVNEMGGD